ncbi:uncharacterized protein TM35_000151910 [Trypanosoma theileri]|uniref:Transport protein particle (TRAPP) subunit n=1 Tax=Trypanosoma theileri TaxID=67003 RepID=A0A1X0NXB5_9TRYP|nr:uncharacterized protein TM35_000151910 [Trypanosoma theileri]ORC88760.1 hypothetical protein TM35_000151910 [Trypanosoma theileri]
MAHHTLVSESVVSGLSFELVSYAIRRQSNEMEENSSLAARNEIELNALKDLEGIGLLIGLRLSERLLYREATFGVSTPLDVARFVGQQLWKSAFGKKIDRMKHMDNVYFSLIDNNFRWLQGFSRLKTGYVVSTLVVCPPGYSEGSVASDEASPSRRERIENSPSHKDILVYTVGILRGVTQVLYPHGSIRIHATLNPENETQFILDFRPQTSS